MSLHFIGGVLAMASPPSQQGSGGPSGLLTIGPQLILMVLVFYFIFIRPQQKKAKDHNALLKTLKAGDKILTSGGIVGVVVGVKEKTVSLRSADTKLEILKSAVTEVTERGSEGGQS